MKPWLESRACASRSFCIPCRFNTDFRTRLHSQGVVSSPGFDCPYSITKESLSNPNGLGSIVEKITKPFASLLPCYDENKQLKPTSHCFKNKQKLNALTAPLKQTK